MVQWDVLSATNCRYCRHRSPRNPLFLILLQTLCRSQKSQLLWNQANPNSFAQTPGVGCTSQKPSSRISTFQTPSSRPGYKLVTASSICSPFVFMALRIAFSATHLFSKSSALPYGFGAQHPSEPASEASATFGERQDGEINSPLQTRRRKKGRLV